MGEQKPEKTKKHICAGLLAHVDAGKTTLSEGILYLTGKIRKLGRWIIRMLIWTFITWRGSAESRFFPSRRSLNWGTGG